MFDLHITVKMINLLAFIGDVYEVIDVPQNEAMGARHSNTVVFIEMEVVSDLQNVFRVKLGDWEAHFLVLSPEPGPLFWELSVYIYICFGFVYLYISFPAYS